MEELATRRAVLRTPAFTRGKKQMTAKDIDISRQIALVGIRVERAIGRLEKFTILNNTIPITQVDLTNNIMVSIDGIIDLNASVVKKSLNTLVINITSSFLYCTIYILT